YHSYFVGHDGATPGMRLLDVEIRVWTGRRPDYVQAFLVALLFYATVLPTSWLVLVVALFNERNRTLHDLLTGTLAVRRSRHPDLGAQAA
ncbi:MAG: RDD family protein, partial [Kiloniellales bacterium]